MLPWQAEARSGRQAAHTDHVVWRPVVGGLGDLQLAMLRRKPSTVSAVDPVQLWLDARVSVSPKHQLIYA
jgi:hypothetical protein